MRSYGQACPVAHALDLVGDRWALIVVRELRLGGRRFADLQSALPGIGPSVLSTRLRELEQTGVVAKNTQPASGRVYELTDWGGELEPVFAALAAWGMRSPVVPIAGELTEDAVLLGLRTLFAPGDQSWQASYEVRLEREVYALDVRDGALIGLARRRAEAPDATVHTDARTLHELLLGGKPDAGRITVTGDAGAAQRLFDALGSRPN